MFLSVGQGLGLHDDVGSCVWSLLHMRSSDTCMVDLAVPEETDTGYFRWSPRCRLKLTYDQGNQPWKQLMLKLLASQTFSR